MIPTALSHLEALAWNLWWSWDAEAEALFAGIDPFRWARNRHNPVALLQDLEPETLARLADDEAFRASLEGVYARFQAYLRASTWTAASLPALSGKRIAYLSMEFGLHESLRQYSGGLGVLAGDHLRSASDLGVPLVGVGLLYAEGYFRQLVDEGRQIAAYPRNEWRRLPLHRCLDERGEQRVIQVPIGTETVSARLWRLDVGRIQLILLDSDFEANSDDHRNITAHLYGGDNRMRLRQELLIGLGAPRALDALGLTVDCWHLNEGHCAFVTLALAARALQDGATSEAAFADARTRVVFTTHTPVPAGHDCFEPALARELIGPWWRSIADDERYLTLGRVRPDDDAEPLNMTVLSLRGSTAANGVSALHGRVSREMWGSLWPDRAVADVPIGHVTNGVHPLFFTHPDARELFDQYVPGWRERTWDPDVWAGALQIPDEALHLLRRRLRARMVQRVAERAHKSLDPDSLTFGFARRFATYKRGNLLFSSPERLYEAISGPRGAQIVFSGKAHPKDQMGQAVLADVVRWSESAEFRDRVVFVEDYDLEVGRLLTSGCDVWVNNPRRPHEASGTSGQKVIFNGGLNLSILDGWWPEGFDGTNGWAIGDDVERADEQVQDAVDAASLIDVLCGQVLPEWRDCCDLGLPRAWLHRVKRSIATLAPLFSSHRMVRDYAIERYAPVAHRA